MVRPFTRPCPIAHLTSAEQCENPVCTDVCPSTCCFGVAGPLSPYLDLFKFASFMRTWTRLDAVAGVGGTAPRAFLAGYAACAIGTDLYVYGDMTLYRYSTISMEWSIVDAAAGVTGTAPLVNGQKMASVGQDLYIIASGDFFMFSTTHMNWTKLKLAESVAGTWSFSGTTDTMSSMRTDLYVFQARGGLEFEVLRYSSVRKMWEKLTETMNINGTAPSARQGHTMSAVGKEIYLFGGGSVELFKFSTTSASWMRLDDVVTGTGPSIGDGYVMATVGSDIFVHGGEPASELFQYSTTDMHWTKLDPAAGVVGEMPLPRRGHAIASVRQDLYVFGGLLYTDDTNPPISSADFYKYDTGGKTWRKLDAPACGSTTWPSPRSDHAMASVSSDIYLMGGQDFGSVTHYADIWRFSTIDMEWKIIDAAAADRSVPTGRIFHTMTALGRVLYVFGGQTSTGMCADQFIYSTTSRTWTQVDATSDMMAMGPTARTGHGMAAAGTDVYVFGGYTGEGVSSEFFMAIGPRAHDWPARKVGLSYFSRIYDLDIVRATSEAHWDWKLELCTNDLLPCSLMIVGESEFPSTVHHHPGSKISCDGDRGCTNLIFEDITVECSNKPSATSPVQISGHGARAIIWNTTFVDCRSVGDGGSIRAYGGAVLQVSGASFLRSISHANGGAAAFVGASASIASSSFIGCGAAHGLGGALSAQGDVQSYPLPVRPTSLHLEGCLFSGNSAQVGGSLALVTSAQAVVANCTFAGNAATESGGAVSISDSSQISISASEFTANTATQSGGAVCITLQSVTKIAGSTFAENKALGLGGAALFSSGSTVDLFANAFLANSAPWGGGGVLLWSGTAPNVRMACHRGWFASQPDDNTPHVCSPCAPGSYKDSFELASCTLCRAGKFSDNYEAQSESECQPCAVGTFQNKAGSSFCYDCPENSHSAPGSTSCLCNAGYFADGTESSCRACADNAYSPAGSNDASACSCRAGYVGDGVSSCDACAPGTFWLTCQDKDVEYGAPEGICSLFERGQLDCLTAISDYGVPADMCCACAEDKPTCSQCPVGTFQNETSGSSCTLCRAGTYAEASGASACETCPEGTFQNGTGSSSCGILAYPRPAFEGIAGKVTGNTACISKIDWDDATADVSTACDWDLFPAEMTDDDCVNEDEFQDFFDNDRCDEGVGGGGDDGESSRLAHSRVCATGGLAAVWPARIAD